MIKYLVKLPILKRLIPSLGIRIFKFLKINRGFYKINEVYFYLDFLDPVDRQIIINKKYEDDAVKFLETEFNKKIKMITWYKHGYAKTNSIIFEDHHDKKDSKVFSANLKVGDEMINYQNEKLCIKIDVEGHEISVLKGLINNLSQNKCLILIEIGDDKFKLVNDFLVANNYKMIFKSHFRLDYIYSNL